LAFEKNETTEKALLGRDNIKLLYLTKI